MTVDWQYNLNFLDDKFNHARLLLLPAARHHLANEEPVLREQYFSFLREQLS